MTERTAAARRRVGAERLTGFGVDRAPAVAVTGAIAEIRGRLQTAPGRDVLPVGEMTLEEWQGIHCEYFLG